jgi:hypothetical protein
MTQSRWLLLMQSVPEPDAEGPSFQLVLRNLDKTSDSVPVHIRTLDELLAVLIADWQQHAEAQAHQQLPERS